MIRLAMMSLLLVTTNVMAVPVIAQIAAPSGQSGTPAGGQFSAQGSQQGGQSGTGPGVICNELIAGTFCTPGGSSAGGYGSFSAGTAASDPSLPPCASGMPANELCN
jgi:hypothetical protein